MEDGGEPSTSQTLLGVLCHCAKDEQAWQSFQERYQPLIRRWCARRRLQVADVEDVTQKVLLKMFTNLKSYDPRRGKFRPWLKAVVRNAVLDFIRQQERHPGDRGSGNTEVQDLLNDVEEPETVDFLARELDEEFEHDVQRVLARVQQRVKPDSWQVFVQTEVEGKAKDIVAAEGGKTYTAVCMTISRIRAMLRDEWAKLRRLDPDAPEH
jgi:RNA polymerase sigma-70 factor (ECF subfamily)